MATSAHCTSMVRGDFAVALGNMTNTLAIVMLVDMQRNAKQARVHLACQSL